MRVLLAVSFFTLAPSRVSIAVLPQAAMAGDTVRVTCTVPKNPTNRLLVMGIPGYTTSEIQLDGDGAPVTHRQYYRHIPCDVEIAICVVVDDLGKQFPASAPLTVAGCGESSGQQ